jgi:sugar-specific transcriptional regulator TrmB
MKPVSSNLVESLKTLGLTEYEAKVYSALVLFDRAEVKQVYEYLDAPKPSVYQSLKTLMDKGLVQVVNAKPAIYRAIPPKIAIKHLADVHRQAEEAAMEELEELEQSRVTQEIPDILWTLYGDENIDHTIEELLGKARQSARLMLPDSHLKYLELLRDREIAVELITFGCDAAIPETYGLKYLTMRDALTIDIRDLAPILKNAKLPPIPPENWTKFILVMVDGEEFMYIPPFPGPARSGLTSRNTFVISLANMVFSTMWERMHQVYPEQHKPGHHV